MSTFHWVERDLWESTPPSRGRFDPQLVQGLPPVARAYLEHAIAPNAGLATAVRLRMRGEIKLKSWLPFRAEQVIRPDRGMIWRATVRQMGLPISGFDRYLDGEGAMSWRLLGLIPVARAEGEDVTRSALGRLHGELVWLPTALLGPEVRWQEEAPNRIAALVDSRGLQSTLRLTVSQEGRLEALSFRRWGNPGGGPFRFEEFGGVAEQERRFGAFTIPARLRLGWYFGSHRFDSEGQFFRCDVEHAEFR